MTDIAIVIFVVGIVAVLAFYLYFVGKDEINKNSLRNAREERRVSALESIAKSLENR